MPTKEKKKKPKAKAGQADVEKGGSSWWPQSSSEDDASNAAPFFKKDDIVQCGDFGDEWQPGKVVQEGRQWPPGDVTFDIPQIPHDKRPKIRPDDWDKGTEGYVWDIVVSGEANQREQASYNGAKDLPVAGLVIMAIVAWGSLDMIENVMRLVEIVANPNESITAFDLAKLGNDTISIVLCLLVYLLWSTLCFKFVHIRHIWSWKPWFLHGQSMLPGGFIPRPAAISLGLLMFLSSVFISERVVGGAALFTRNADGSYKSNVAHGEWCRADVREKALFQDEWFSRLGRLNPAGCFLGVCPEGSLDPGCQSSGMPLSPLLFDTSLNASAMPHPNMVHPYQRTSHITLIIYQGLQGMFPSLFGHLQRSDSLVIDEEYTCMYQCVKWRAYGFNEIVSKVGTIGAGNAIVSRATETATSLLGKTTITADTTAPALGILLDRARPIHAKKSGTLAWIYKRFHKSAAIPAILFAFLRGFLSFFVYKIDDHGFFTVDYYVSQVLLFAICSSIICRKYNVFRLESVLYCNNLWTQGSEEFIIPDSVDGDATAAKPKTVDLLLWLHMSFEERAYLLIHFARKVSGNAKSAINARVECFMEQAFEVSVLGNERTKESRIVLVKRHQFNDSWPQGRIFKMKDGMAHVQWDEEHVCPDLQDDDGKWLERLKEHLNNGACPTCKYDLKCKDRQGLPCKICEKVCQATTTPVDPKLLFDKGEEWDKLMTKFVGRDAEAVDGVRGKILWRIQRDQEDRDAKWAPMGGLAPKDKKQGAKLTDAEEAKHKEAKVKADEATKKKQERHFVNHRGSTSSQPNLDRTSNARTALLTGSN